MEKLGIIFAQKLLETVDLQQTRRYIGITSWDVIRRDFEDFILDKLSELPGPKIFEVQIKGWNVRVLALADTKKEAMRKAEIHAGASAVSARLVYNDVVELGER